MKSSAYTIYIYCVYLSAPQRSQKPDIHNIRIGTNCRINCSSFSIYLYICPRHKQTRVYFYFCANNSGIFGLQTPPQHAVAVFSLFSLWPLAQQTLSNSIRKMPATTTMAFPWYAYIHEDLRYGIIMCCQRQRHQHPRQFKENYTFFNFTVAVYVVHIWLRSVTIGYMALRILLLLLRCSRLGLWLD